MKVARRLFFTTLTVAIAAEGSLGWYFIIDIKSWAPATGVAFSIPEVCLIICTVLWMARSGSDRKRYTFQRGRLLVPAVCFGAAIALGTVWGLVRGGDNLTYALFEVRDFAVMILTYFLVGMLFRDEQDLSRLVWCILIGVAALALNDTYAYYFVFHGTQGLTDLSYDHVDSLLLVFGFTLCAGLIVFHGTRAQRRVALVLMPFIVFCLEVMHRRVAFAVLPIGLIAFGIVFYRLRPKMFWRVGPVIVLLATLYVAAFWNNTSSFGQPARAIRSQFSPDSRDANSDQYRLTERADILQNILSARIMGLGFGQQYTFYYPLPDLSFWQFWHYTSHDAVLWVWMDGGIPAFLTFFWLLGAGAQAGGQELATRREAWSLTQIRVRPWKRRVGQRATGRQRQEALVPAAHAVAVGTSVPSSVPPWMRKFRRARPGTAEPSGASLALLAAGLALLPIQITFSYVDLGLTSVRAMLVLGVALGVLGRTFVSGPAKARRKLGAAPAPDGDTAAVRQDARAQPASDGKRHIRYDGAKTRATHASSTSVTRRPPRANRVTPVRAYADASSLFDALDD